MPFNRHLPPVDTSRFSMVPRQDIPRSTFKTQHTLKTTFQAGYLVPIHVDEVLPGDVHVGQVTIFARLATPLFPIMDNVQLETFFFFCPARICWTNWVKFMGEQDNPADSISFTVPTASGAAAVCSLQDYMGTPVTGMLAAGTYVYNVLPYRAYNRIWNEWFRDENLQNSIPENLGDGPDSSADYVLRKRNKKHDYFTSCLPWPQKGGVAVQLPLTGNAKVLPQVTEHTTAAGTPSLLLRRVDTGATVGNFNVTTGTTSALAFNAVAGGAATAVMFPTNLIADLSSATGTTINALRLAMSTQQFLEKDARGGTRYTELLRNHFGVHPEDARLQRPEYIGGGCSTIQTSAVPQTSATGITGGAASAYLGSLAAAGVVAGSHEFSYHASEHGYIIGLVEVSADLTYQQGVHRMWSRSTRFDFYWPTFAHLGEQIVRNDEIMVQGVGSGTDALAFGYQERWAEYRHRPSRISGLFRSTSAGTIDPWHLAIKFLALPVLNTSFIEENPPFARVLAASTAADNMQILFDSVFNIRCTRAIPQFSVPGLTRF